MKISGERNYTPSMAAMERALRVLRKEVIESTIGLCGMNENLKTDISQGEYEFLNSVIRDFEPAGFKAGHFWNVKLRFPRLLAVDLAILKNCNSSFHRTHLHSIEDSYSQILEKDSELQINYWKDKADGFIRLRELAGHYFKHSNLGAKGYGFEYSMDILFPKYQQPAKCPVCKSLNKLEYIRNPEGYKCNGCGAVIFKSWPDEIKKPLKKDPKKMVQDALNRDVPVFVLKATDRFAYETIKYYEKLVEGFVTDEYLEGIKQISVDFEHFYYNGNDIKIPD